MFKATVKRLPLSLSTFAASTFALSTFALLTFTLPLSTYLFGILLDKAAIFEAECHVPKL